MELLFDMLVLLGVVALVVAFRRRRDRLRVLGGLAGVVVVGLLFGGCNFAGGLWGAAEDIFGPQGMFLRQIDSTEDTALGGLWGTAKEALDPLSVVGQDIKSTVGGQFQSTCG